MNKIYAFFFVTFLSSISYAQFNCGDSLLDTRDGQKYATVLIGSDCWFKQNLNYGSLVTSDSSGTIHSNQTNNGIPEKYAQYNNSANLSIYGGLYEQAELMNYSSLPQGLCPNGWHVSTDLEWSQLISSAGASMISSSAGTGGNKLKKIGEGFGSGTGTDAVGFSAKHGGDRDGFGIFYGMGYRSIFWTSTASGPNQAYHYTLWAENDTIERLSLGTQTTGFSCRCVKDAAAEINTHSFEKDIQLYPNPTARVFTISSPISMNNIQIYSLSGQLLEVFQFNENTYEAAITLPSFEKGLYFINLIDLNGNLIATKKLYVD